jgi:hypothetical protein
MSKSWIILTGLLLLGSAGPSQAHPLDSPDIVYIDGLPCNRACQSWMNWSWRKHSPAATQSAPGEFVRAESDSEEARVVIRVHEQPTPRAAHSASRHASPVRREGGRAATPRVAKRPATPPATTIAKTEPEPAAAQNSTPMLSDAKTPRAADVAAVVPENEPARQPVAAAPAEQVTVANGVPQIEAANSEAPGQSEAAKPRDGEPTMSVATTDRTGKSADNVDRRVALVMARPEIQSVSDLAGKDIAIEGEQSASTTSIQSAIASAGAADVRLDEKPARAIDRVVGGEVPAAVLNLVSPEAAQSFPDIPGYRIFRIPLAPG